MHLMLADRLAQTGPSVELGFCDKQIPLPQVRDWDDIENHLFNNLRNHYQKP